jgi:hypothetical protein
MLYRVRHKRLNYSCIFAYYILILCHYSSEIMFSFEKYPHIVVLYILCFFEKIKMLQNLGKIVNCNTLSDTEVL